MSTNVADGFVIGVNFLDQTKFVHVKGVLANA